MVDTEELEFLRDFIRAFNIRFNENTECLPIPLQVEFNKNKLEDIVDVCFKDSYMKECVLFFGEFYEALQIKNMGSAEKCFEEARKVLKELVLIRSL